MKLFETFGEIVIKDDGVDAKLSGIDAKASALAGTLGKLAMTGVAAAGAALGGLATRGVMLASDLQEVQNVVDTVFGEQGAAKINEFAKSAMESFGLSELQAKKFTSTMGAMISSMGLAPEEVSKMSQSLAGLSGDMASFYNLKPEEAFEKLRAGIAGETEPLKQLGINMSVANLEAYALSQGINKSVQEMTQAEQASLRYSYIMQATAQSQGDFAKTSDSFANQLRIVQGQFDTIAVTIGNQVIPYLQQFLAWVLDSMPQIQSTIESAVTIAGGVLNGLADTFIWLKNNISWILPVLAGFLSAVVALNVINTVIGLMNAWKASTIAQTLAQGGLNAVLAANPIGLVILAIGALVAAGVALWMNWDTVKAKLGELWESFKDNFGKIKDFVKGVFDSVTGWIDSFISKIEAAIQKVKDLFSAGGGSGTPNVPYTRRAAGGNVSAPNTYLVGENGPELFTPSVNGYIVPNTKLFGQETKTVVEEKITTNMPVTINVKSPFEVIKEVQVLNKMLVMKPA